MLSFAFKTTFSYAIHNGPTESDKKTAKKEDEIRRFSGSYARFQDIYIKLLSMFDNGELLKKKTCFAHLADISATPSSTASMVSSFAGSSTAATGTANTPLPSVLTIEYVDDENDRILIRSDVEWIEALRIHELSGANYLRLFVYRTKKDVKEFKRLEDLAAAQEKVQEHQPTIDRSIPTALTAAARDDDAEEQEEIAQEMEISSPTIHRPEIPALRLPTTGSEDSTIKPVDMQVVDELLQNDMFADNEDNDATATDNNDIVLELISGLYNCNAAEDLVAGTVDMSPCVTRTVDDDTQEIHVDIDRSALRHKTIVDCNKLLENAENSQAEKLLKLALVLFPADQVIEYNLACALSLQDRIDEALIFLTESVKHGFDDYECLCKDADLFPLHGDAAFNQILATIRPKQAEEETVVAEPTPVVAEEEKKAEEAPAPAPEEEKEDAPVAPAPAAPVVPQIEVSDSAKTLMSIFPALRADEAEAILVANRGNLSAAVQRLLEF